MSLRKASKKKSNTKKKKETALDKMQSERLEVDGYVMEYVPKIRRVLANREVDITNENAVLAEYDKLGGLITKDGVKVETGAFYDFKAKKPKYSEKKAKK